MLNKDCEMFGGYCLCSACQSMRKTLQELSDLNLEDKLERESAKKVYAEMEKALEELKNDG